MTLLSNWMLVWMAVTAIGYWLLKPALQVPFLVAVTLGFLLWAAPWSGLALAAIALTAYGAVRVSNRQRRAVLAAIGALVAVFFAYKFHVSRSQLGLPHEVLLLGFSFYMLRAIHYLVEHEKGTLPAHGLIDFLGYMFFLPTLLVGPIQRFGDHMREVRRRRWDPALLSQGLERMLFGYAKIVLLANYLVNLKMAHWIAMIGPDHPGLAAYLDCLRYGLKLYFTFAGYSDVAIGFALLLGLRVAENFNFPFLKTNIQAFWRSWHISLSSWCRDYIYTPAVAFTRQPAAAVVCSMVALGLWHELSPRYVLWGAYHGVGIAAWQAFQSWKPALPAPRHPWARHAATAGAWFLTFNFVVLSFAITKETSLEATMAVYRQLLTP